MSDLHAIRELRQIHFKRDDRHADLPAFENFGVQFADEAERCTGDDDSPHTAFEERRMLERLQAVFFSYMVEEHVQAGMDFRKMRRGMGEHRAKNGVCAGTEFMRWIGNRDLAGFEQAMWIKGSARRRLDS